MLRVIDRGEGWIVLATWHGAERTVYGPCGLFEAVRWAARHG